MNDLDMLQIALGGDLNPTLRAELPSSVHSALHGDRTPLLRLAARSEGLNEINGAADGDQRRQRRALRGHALRGDALPVGRAAPARVTRAQRGDRGGPGAERRLAARRSTAASRCRAS